MSHTVKIQSQFKNMKVVQKVLAKHGWSMKTNSTIRSYNSHDNNVYDYVGVNPDVASNAYDLAFQKEGNHYECLGDFYGGSIAKTLGADISKLRQGYTLQCAQDEFEPQGFEVTSKELASGELEITIEK